MVETQNTNSEQKNKRKGPNIAQIKKLQQERLEKEAQIRAEELRVEEENKKKIEESKRIAFEDQIKIEEEKKKSTKNRDVKVIKNFQDLILTKTKKVEENIEKREILTGDEKMRSPIICILGHVDTGKTKILDKLRESNVQAGEAGGITQQIGATYFPIENVFQKFGITSTLPGILVIDTPGHESFSNLRSRGSSLCDLAILVVDAMHLLEPQTIESINLLKLRKTPFVIALNKIDRCLNSEKPMKFSECDKKTRKRAEIELESKIDETIVKLAEIELNAKLFSKNESPRKYVSIVPTSAITGDGLNDLVKLIFNLCESFMAKKCEFKENFECVVLEVKNVEGHGTTLDCILVNGRLNENDRICVAGFNGPVVTRVKSILVPQPMKEMRVKFPFVSVKSVRASIGLKISALDLENTVAGSKVYKVEENEEEAKKIVMEDFNSALSKIKTASNGIHIQASTLGSLEALAIFLEKEGIPIGSYNIGKVNKTDIIRASVIKNRAVVLCFDVIVDKEMIDLAKSLDVKIFEAKIIYHLLDKYKKFIEESSKIDKEIHLVESIFPFELEIVPKCVFTTRTPLVLGVEVKRGKLNIGTPCFVNRNGIEKLGIITSIEKNKKKLNNAVKGDKIAIKIECGVNDGSKVFGRNFIETDLIYSMISRRSIDALKLYFKDELGEEEIKLIVELKRLLEIN